MLDVHPPNHPVHGWRDFFIHLITITIGLVIALSLERLVELRHRHHLVKDAEVALHTEIEDNSNKLDEELQRIKAEQRTLADDVAILNAMIANPRALNQQDPVIQFNVPAFDDVSWKTAQSTGALSYMTYKQAHEYGEIYNDQSEVYVAEHEAARDAMASYALMVNRDKAHPKMNPADAPMMKQRIELFQTQLIMVESFLMSLDKKYKAFLAAHQS